MERAILGGFHAATSSLNEECKFKDTFNSNVKSYGNLLKILFRDHPQLIKFNEVGKIKLISYTLVYSKSKIFKGNLFGVYKC